MQTPLQAAIRQNQIREARRNRAANVLRNVRKRVFDYEDQGKGEKAARVIETCKRILTPRWEAQSAAAKARIDAKLLRKWA